MRVAVSILLLWAASGGPEVEAETPRRVIWVAVDSLRADHLRLGGYDRATSPWLDQLAESSAVFTSAFSPANSTGFSVAATFAGKHYSLLDHDSHPPHIPPDVETLPLVFQKGGFRTFGWITNAVLIASASNGLALGFDEWHKIIPKSAPKPDIDRVIAYVNQNYESTSEREFHYVHTMDVHDPYVPPIPFDRLWPEHVNTGAVRYGTMRHADRRTVLSNLPYHSEGHNVQDTDIAFLKTQYDGAVRFTDSEFPALLDALQYDPDNDLLIISADHGEQLFEHNFWGHGKSLYPEEINVPLIIQGPGITPGLYTGPMSLIDLFPTLCELFGLESPDTLLGVSLLPTLVAGSPVPLHPVYSEMPYWTGGVFAPEAAIIHGTDMYKLAVNAHWLRPWQIWPFAEELYRLDVDPQCRDNVAETSRERVEELNGLLRETNPRYEPYTTDAIRGKDADVALGPELMPELSGESGKRVRMRTASIRAGVNGGASLFVPEANLDMFVTTSSGLAHLLEVRYTLDSGVYRLSMYDEKSGEPFWEYTLRKVGHETRTIQAMITPPRRASRLSIKALVPGKVHLQSISLRVAPLPNFELVEWKRATTEAESETEADQREVRTALEALGYVD